jgi:hypothetical protein
VHAPVLAAQPVLAQPVWPAAQLDAQQMPFEPQTSFVHMWFDEQVPLPFASFGLQVPMPTPSQ